MLLLVVKNFKNPLRLNKFESRKKAFVFFDPLCKKESITLSKHHQCLANRDPVEGEKLLIIDWVD